MEVLPHYGCVFRSCRVQLHIQILAEHVDSIERADDRERKLLTGGGAAAATPTKQGNPARGCEAQQMHRASRPLIPHLEARTRQVTPLETLGVDLGACG